MIELADLVRQLRAELNRARTGADGEDLRFELGPIELEVTVGVEREAGADGRIRFWVVELGADARAIVTSTQRIRLTLTPGLAGAVGAPVFVSGDEAEHER